MGIHHPWYLSSVEVIHPTGEVPIRRVLAADANHRVGSDNCELRIITLHEKPARTRCQPSCYRSQPAAAP